MIRWALEVKAQMRAILYSRVSLGNGEQDPEKQAVALREHAERQGWQVVADLTDEASSVAYRKRTAWKKALAMIEAGKADVLAVWRLDRGFRSMVELARTVEVLKAHGAHLASVTENLDTTTPAGEAMFWMLGVFAQFERAAIRERTKAAMAHVKRYGSKSGRPIGRPVGWRKRPAGT